MTRARLAALFLFLCAPGARAEETASKGFGALSPEAARSASRVRPARRFVVAVGVNRFADPFWQPLSFAEKDASDVFKSFQNASPAFSEGELVTPATVNGGIVRTRDVIRALEKLEQAGLQEQDTVVFYVSTHGTIFYRKGADAGDQGGELAPFLAFSDTNHEDIHGTALEREAVVARFERLQAGRKAIIIASCHSGGGKARLTPAIAEALKRQKGVLNETASERLAGTGTLVLSASSWSEPAEEDAALGNDVYTHYLLRGMATDDDGNGFVTLGEAHDFATRATMRHTGGRQHPSIRMERSGGDPIVLGGKLERRGVAFLYSYLNKLVGYEVAIAGTQKGPVHAGLQVPAGKHRVEIRDPASGALLMSRVVRFDEGKEYSIADILRPRRPFAFEGGLASAVFLPRNMRLAYAPAAAFGPAVRFAWEDAVAVFDLYVEAAWLRSERERVNADAGLQPLQDRSWLQLEAGLGGREALKSLSVGGADLEAEWGWALGLAAGIYQRTLEEPEPGVLLRPRQRRASPGVAARLGVTWKQEWRGLRFGLELRPALWSTAGFAGAPLLSASLGQALWLGYQW